MRINAGGEAGLLDGIEVTLADGATGDLEEGLDVGFPT